MGGSFQCDVFEEIGCDNDIRADGALVENLRVVKLNLILITIKYHQRRQLQSYRNQSGWVVNDIHDYQVPFANTLRLHFSLPYHLQALASLSQPFVPANSPWLTVDFVRNLTSIHNYLQNCRCCPLSTMATAVLTGSFARNHRTGHRNVRSVEDEVVPRPLQIVKRSVSSSTTDRNYQPPAARRNNSAGSFSSDASMESIPESPRGNTSLAIPKIRENKALGYASASMVNLLEGHEQHEPVNTVNLFRPNRK